MLMNWTRTKNSHRDNPSITANTSQVVTHKSLSKKRCNQVTTPMNRAHLGRKYLAQKGSPAGRIIVKSSVWKTNNAKPEIRHKI